MECKVYKKRWVILLLYWAYSITSIMHWSNIQLLQTSSLHYSVPYSLVNWTSMIFLMIPVMPGCYILDRLGLPATHLIGATGICLGAWLKVLSVNPNRFWVLMLGQFVIAIFQILIFPVPPKLAAVSFGSKEVTSACSIGVAAIQVAIGKEFIIPPLMVEHGSFEDMEKSLQNLSYVFAIPITAVIPLLYFFFDNAPPTPPSVAQIQIQEIEKKPIVIKKLSKEILFFVFICPNYDLDLRHKNINCYQRKQIN